MPQTGQINDPLVSEAGDHDPLVSEAARKRQLRSRRMNEQLDQDVFTGSGHEAK